MATDLFLRSKPKLQTTDLWLHPAGADGSAPADVSDSGTVTTVAAFAALEALADGQTLSTVASFDALVSLTLPPWPDSSDVDWDTEFGLRWPPDSELEPVGVTGAPWDDRSGDDWSDGTETRWTRSTDGRSLTSLGTRWPPDDDDDWS